MKEVRTFVDEIFVILGKFKSWRRATNCRHNIDEGKVLGSSNKFVFKRRTLQAIVARAQEAEAHRACKFVEESKKF